MASTQDKMTNQLSQSTIDTLVSRCKTLGATHIAISCPMDAVADYPEPKPTAGYMLKWINSIRAQGLSVYHRGSFINFKGIYTATHNFPNSTPGTATGVEATVLNGSDTSSYLYKVWKFIKDNPTFFQSGDVWGPVYEPENEGIGADLSTKMFASYTTVAQWLVDMKTVSDSAFSDIGVSGVITGMTSVNGGTVRDNHIGSSYWSQIGRCAIDHYVSQEKYGGEFDTMSTNAGVDLYVGEWGPTAGAGGADNDSYRFDEMVKVITTLNAKSYIKGFNFWRLVGYTGSHENIINPVSLDFYQSAGVLKRVYQGTSRVPVL